MKNCNQNFTNLIIFSFLINISKSNLTDYSESIFNLNKHLFVTKDFEIWDNKSIKWIDKMQINTILFDNLLIFTGGCERKICSCPGIYSSLRIEKDTVIFESNWTKGKLQNLIFNKLYIPYFNLEREIKYDFKIDSFSMVKEGKMIWNVSVNQGEFYFKNPLYKKCSFTYEIFIPGEYIENRKKELNDIISKFYNDNQDRFVDEHIKKAEKKDK